MNTTTTTTTKKKGGAVGPATGPASPDRFGRRLAEHLIDDRQSRACACLFVFALGSLVVGR